MFCVGFGLLGGILLRLPPTIAGPSFPWDRASEGKNDEDDDGDDDGEGGGWGLAMDTLSPKERMRIAMAKIRAMIEWLKKDFMALICCLRGCLLLALCFY